MGQKEMYNSILALSVGDATGENELKILPSSKYMAGNVANERNLTGDMYCWTDDTAMAIGVYRTLCRYGTINQVELAKEFARNAKADPQRGYGKGTQRLLFNYLYDVENWRDLSEHAWGVTPMSGSKGNGSAMRDSIIGAYFTSLDDVVVNAALSAQVTHFHLEAMDGSKAVAVASHMATYHNIKDYWPTILRMVHSGPMYDAIKVVAQMDPHQTNWEVVGAVGNGSKVSAMDTVPFALWQAHQALVRGLSFEEVVQSIIEVGGDTDTVAAMVGGIIGNKIQPTQEWMDRTEQLPSDIYV